MKTILCLLALVFLAGCITRPEPTNPFDAPQSDWNWNQNSGQWETVPNP